MTTADSPARALPRTSENLLLHETGEGTPVQLAGIVKAYKVFYAKVPQAGGDYTIDHTASIYLMDSKGRFIGTIAYGEDQRTAVEKLQRLASS